MKTNKQILIDIQKEFSLSYSTNEIEIAMNALRKEIRDELQKIIDKAIDDKSYKIGTYKLEHFILKI